MLTYCVKARFGPWSTPELVYLAFVLTSIALSCATNSVRLPRTFKCATANGGEMVIDKEIALNVDLDDQPVTIK